MRIFDPAAIANVFTGLCHDKQRRRQKQNIFSRFTGRVGQTMRRVACVVLLVSMLATSTPAASQTIVAVAGEWQADLAFWLRTNELPVALYRRLIGWPPERVQPQEKQEERDGRIARIEIQKPKETIQIGEELLLSAIAYDRNNVPVGGVAFQWRSDYPSQDFQSGMLPHGAFVAKVPGEYSISAEANGFVSSVNIKVAAPPVVTDSSVRQEPIVRQVSSNSVDEHPDKSSRSAIRLTPETEFVDGDAYGWNSNNKPAAFIPQNERGETPGRSTVEANSNNFSMQAPILSLPGRGLDLDLSLVYNSRVWSKTNNANHDIVFDADRDQVAPGWSFNFRRLVNMVDAGCFIIEEDGTRHSFSGRVVIDPYSGERNFWGVTTDGSFIEYAVVTRGLGTSNVDTYGIAKYPDGLEVTFVGGGSIGNANNIYVLYTSFLKDNNGNYLMIICNYGRVLNIIDTLGRVVTFHYDSNNLLTAITAAGLKDEAGNVTNRTFMRLHYKQLALDYSFQGLTPVVRNSTIWVLDTIYYPSTRTGHWFGDGDSYSSYGMLKKLSERKGMTFSDGPLTEQGTFQPGTMTREMVYDYPATPIANLTDAPGYHTMTETWEGSTTGPAVTHFDVVEEGETRTVTTTLPDQTKSVEYSYVKPGQFDNGLVYKVEVRQGSNVLQTTTTTWEAGDELAPRIKRRDFTDSLGQNRYQTYGYGDPAVDLYNRLRELAEFDYSGNLLRKTSMTYTSSGPYSVYTAWRLYPTIDSMHGGPSAKARLLYLVTSIEVSAGDGSRLSRVEYEYDGYGDGYDPNAGDILNTPGVVSQDGYYYWNWFGFKYRGNVTKVTSYADAANLGGPLTTLLTYDRTGNVRTVTKSGKQRAFTFTLDTQYTFPTTEVAGSPDSNSAARITTGMTYDFNSGLPLSATDANSRNTQSTYYLDSWRLKKETAPTGATKLSEYDDVALSSTQTTKGSDGTIAASSTTKIDGRGQVIKVEALGANGWDTVETQYDAMGRNSKESRPYSASQTPRWSETFYDVLGRITRIVTPDGSDSKVFYNETARPSAASTTPGETARAVDAWGRERWTLADALGRTIEQVEPDPNGNGSVMAANSLLTKYSYDALGNLTQVEQGQQLRRFRYDSLGRLTQQKMAEADATLNNAGGRVAGGEWSNVFSYDERSNLVLEVDARGVKTNFGYGGDPLDRLQSITCDTSGVPAGEVVHPAAPITYQYMPSGDITRVQSITAASVSTESFGYDSEARLNAKTVVFNTRDSYPALTEYTYDSLDRVTDIRYPVQYGTINNARKMVHHEYDVASRLSGLKVDGAYFASQIAYNAASQKTSVLVGTGTNQVTESYDYDPLTSLLTRQKVQRTGSTLMDLTYDYLRQGTSSGRTGQLTRLVNNLNDNRSRNYSYDALGRLQQAKGGPENSPLWTQTYTYDRYGNRVGVSASGYVARGPVRATHDREATQTASSLNPKVLTINSQLALSSSSNSYAQPEAEGEAGQQLSHAEPMATAEPQRAAGENRRNSHSRHHASRSTPVNPQAAAPTFTDDPLNDPQLPEKSRVKTIHLTELRAAIDAIRIRLGLAAYSWQAAVTGLITIDPIVEMRLALDQALGAPALGYSPGLDHNLPIQAIHIQELRNRVIANWNYSGEIPRDGYASLSYDAASNRITTAGFQYDAAGNQTRVVRADGSAVFYEYDAANRLAKVRNQNQNVIASYTYGETNQRMMAQDGDDNSNQRTYYLWSGPSVIAEYVETPASPAAPRWRKNYIYMGGRLLATQEPDGSNELVEFHHPDRLGSRVVTRSDGSSYEQVTLPFGVAINGESTGTNNRRFTSYDRSEITGLDYAVNRSYDSAQGRFTQVDPIGMAAVTLTNPQTLNLYAYCLNDPVNSLDPAGTDGIFSISFPPIFGGGGGGSIFGGLLSGLFSFGLGVLGTLFGRGSSGFYWRFVGGSQAPRQQPTPPVLPPIVISVYGTYGALQESRHGGNQAFFARARRSAGGEANIRPFGTGADLIYTLITMSKQQTRPIDTLNGFFHSVPAGIVGTTPDDVGLYIDYRPHDVYTKAGSDGRTTAYPLNKNTIARGARGTEDLVNAILEGKINIANSGEIVLWGCNTDAMASHISWLLTAGGRGDIRVTGVTKNLDMSNYKYAAADGRFNTYSGNTWTGGPRRRNYR